MSKAVKQSLLTLCERFPQAFFTDPEAIRPLKIGIDQDLRSALPEMDSRLLRHALAHYTRRPAYLKALAQGLARVDLAGLPVAAVTDEQRAHARTQRKAQIERIKAKGHAIGKGQAAKTTQAAAARPEKDPPAAAESPKMGNLRPVLSLKKMSA